MSKDLAVIVIHGMGSQGPGFADDAIEELSEWVEDRNRDPERIAWLPIYWADILEPRQRRYLRDANRNNDLDYLRLRRFVISALGDASAYQKVPASADTTYRRIHDRIRVKVKELYSGDLAATAVPLVVMAHSLGGHIISNYIWDLQNGRIFDLVHRPETDLADLSKFEKMQTLAGMITFGCNIPLFTFAYTKVEPIKFPAPRLRNDLKRKAKWLNFYDPDDVLGYPLKPIGPAYRKVVTRDIAINVGGVFSNWNPASHGGYWTDNDFTKPVADFIVRFL